MTTTIPAIIRTACMVGAFSLIAFAYLDVPPSPMISLGGDSVTPHSVKALEAVTVSRNYEITRNDPMFVVRTMVQGDCSKNCEIIDLPSGYLLREPGVYRNHVRDHVIPSSAQAGAWVLQFSVQWQDRFGRTLTKPLPPLGIEVIQ